MAVHWNKDQNDSNLWKVVNLQGETAIGYHPRLKIVTALVDLYSGEAFAIARRLPQFKAVRM